MGSRHRTERVTHNACQEMFGSVVQSRVVMTQLIQFWNCSQNNLLELPQPSSGRRNKVFEGCVGPAEKVPLVCLEARVTPNRPRRARGWSHFRFVDRSWRR
jgi:hypothetical protein